MSVSVRHESVHLLLIRADTTHPCQDISADEKQ